MLFFVSSRNEQLICITIMDVIKDRLILLQHRQRSGTCKFVQTNYREIARKYSFTLQTRSGRKLHFRIEQSRCNERMCRTTSHQSVSIILGKLCGTILLKGRHAETVHILQSPCVSGILSSHVLNGSRGSKFLNI